MFSPIHVTPENQPDDNTSINQNSGLARIGQELLRRLPLESIKLIPLANRVTVEDIRRHVPDGPVVVCDFYLEGFEHAERISGGFRDAHALIENIDHHAPIEAMFRRVSSGNLAIEYIDQYGVVPAETSVVVHHTDCDSIISSFIMRGLLPPHPAFGQAVIAADHTGEANDIADLLQALESRRDLNFSARNLGLLLTGQPLEAEAQQILDRQLAGRQIAEQLVTQGEVQFFGPVALFPYRHGLRTEYLPALVPQSAVTLIVGEPQELNGVTSPGRSVARLRLGMSAPDGFTIYDLRITEEVDPGYGGRWNAGANRRGGGTALRPEEYARLIQRQYEAAASSMPESQ